MRAEMILVLLLSVAFFMAGITVSYFLGLQLAPLAFGMHPSIDLAVLSFAVFLFSMLFFGYLSPIVLFIIGLTEGQIAAAQPMLVLLGFIPLLIASYAGSATGRYIYLDLYGKANLFEMKKKIAVSLAAAIIVAIAFGFAVEALPLTSGITQSVLAALSELRAMVMGG